MCGLMAYLYLKYQGFCWPRTCIYICPFFMLNFSFLWSCMLFKTHALIICTQYEVPASTSSCISVCMYHIDIYECTLLMRCLHYNLLCCCAIRPHHTSFISPFIQAGNRHVRLSPRDREILLPLTLSAHKLMCCSALIFNLIIICSNDQTFLQWQDFPLSVWARILTNTSGWHDTCEYAVRGNKGWQMVGQFSRQ